eukprot:1169552-Rhodomonas_salina.4
MGGGVRTLSPLPSLRAARDRTVYSQTSARGTWFHGGSMTPVPDFMGGSKQSSDLNTLVDRMFLEQARSAAVYGCSAAICGRG